MKSNLLSRFFQVVCITCMLAGCSTPVAHQLYPGASLPPSEVASLIVPVEINVLSINGESFTWSDRMGRTKPSVIELLPGDYTVTARYYMPGDYNEFGTRDEMPDRSPPVDLNFQAEAGKAYAISFDIVKDGITLWIADAPTGERIPAAVDDGSEHAETITPSISGSEGEAHNLEEMKARWNVLSDEERKEFQKWAIDHP